MAEAFSNKVARAAGIVTSYSGSTVAAGSTAITVTALTGISVSFLVDNQHFIAGTKVVSTSAVSGGVGTVFTDRNSTNTSSASSQTVRFLGPTTAYTSSSTKSVIIGGTFANNTSNSVNLSVEIYDSSVGVTSQVRFRFLQEVHLLYLTLVKHFWNRKMNSKCIVIVKEQLM